MKEFPFVGCGFGESYQNVFKDGIFGKNNNNKYLREL